MQLQVVLILSVIFNSNCNKLKVQDILEQSEEYWKSEDGHRSPRFIKGKLGRICKL